VTAYVGLAKAAKVGAGNLAFHDWSLGAETWAHTLGRNMWGAGKPFTGGC
jgi:hypothetical protein